MRSIYVRVLTMGVALLLLTSPVSATLTLADGGVHNIDYAVHEDILVSSGLLGVQTTVNILAGGSMTGLPRHQLTASDNSIINVLGGSIDGLLIAYDNSQVTVGGGTVLELGAFGSSYITVTDGLIDYLAAGSEGNVVVFGGSIRQQIAIIDDGVITIHGSDFAVDGQPVGYLELSDFGKLTGITRNGGSIDVEFGILGGGTITLVPEPATLLLLGFGGLVLRRRR